MPKLDVSQVLDPKNSVIRFYNRREIPPVIFKAREVNSGMSRGPLRLAVTSVRVMPTPKTAKY